jgi:hypothetical protein
MLPRLLSLLILASGATSCAAPAAGDDAGTSSGEGGTGMACVAAGGACVDPGPACLEEISVVGCGAGGAICCSVQGKSVATAQASVDASTSTTTPCDPTCEMTCEGDPNCIENCGC